MRFAFLAVMIAFGVHDLARAQATLSPGDLVVTEQLGADFQSPKIVRVNPVTGAQQTVASGAPLVNPLGVAIERSGDLIVTDGFDGNSVLRVDPDTGAIAVLSSGFPYLDDPSGVSIAIATNGDIYVADFGPDAIVRIDPLTGNQTLISIGGMLVFPTGLAFEADGNLIVVDREGLDGTGAVIRIDPVTGAQTLLSSGGYLNEPVWVAIEGDGNIVLTERQTFGGAVLRVNRVTGAQSVVSSGNNFQQVAGIAVDGDGDILVADFAAHTVIRIDRTTGAQTVLSGQRPLQRPRRRGGRALPVRRRVWRRQHLHRRPLCARHHRRGCVRLSPHGGRGRHAVPHRRRAMRPGGDLRGDRLSAGLEEDRGLPPGGRRVRRRRIVQRHQQRLPRRRLRGRIHVMSPGGGRVRFRRVVHGHFPDLPARHQEDDRLPRVGGPLRPGGVLRRHRQRLPHRPLPVRRDDVPAVPRRLRPGGVLQRLRPQLPL
jgi:streptogramin lyase